MTKLNIEEIRRKNLEENQRFLKKIGVNNIRNDFLQSARTVLAKGETKKKQKHSYEKVERITRYSLKVKSGEIQPSIPEWQRKLNEKNVHRPLKWSDLYKNNANPYQRIYKPRNRISIQ